MRAINRRALARPRSRLRWFVWALTALSLLGAPALATTYLALSPEALLAKADLAFVGTVSRVRAVDKGGTPWTRVRFTIDTPLKGVPTDAQGQVQRTLELAFLGGAVPGGPSLAVGGMPRFATGEKVLLFAYDQAYASPIVGFRQGLWRVTKSGLVGDDGSFLTLAADGTLVLGGSGAPLASIVNAIRQSLGVAGGPP